MSGARIAQNRLRDSAQTLSGAEPRLAFSIIPVDLHDLRVVDLVGERINNRVQVHLVSVRGQPDPIRKAPGNILKESGTKARIPLTYDPTNNQLRLRFNRR